MSSSSFVVSSKLRLFRQATSSKIVQKVSNRNVVTQCSTATSEWSATGLPSIYSYNNNDELLKRSLPRTLGEAMLERNAAVVVTTATSPHTILYVNQAWERMCGFTKNEVVDQTLRCIQGEATNVDLANSSVEKLEEKKEEVVDLYLINYKKNGTPFTNHLTMGTIAVNDLFDDVKLHVGILEEVNPNEVPLRMV